MLVDRGEFLQHVGGQTNAGERTGFEFAEEEGRHFRQLTGTAIKASASEPEQGRHGLGLLDCFYLFPLLRTPHSLDLSTSILKNPDYPLIKFISRC